MSKKVKTGAKRQEREDNEARTAKETSKAARQLGKGFGKGGKGDFKGGKGPKAQSAKAAGTGKDGMQRRQKESESDKQRRQMQIRTGFKGGRVGRRKIVKGGTRKSKFQQMRQSPEARKCDRGTPASSVPAKSKSEAKQQRRQKSKARQGGPAKTARRAKMQRGNSGNAVLVKWRGQSASQSSLPLGRNKMDAKSW
jgi:hypothetical protein